MDYIVRGVKERLEYINYLKKYIPNLVVFLDTNKSALQNLLHAFRYTNKACVHLEDDIYLTDNFIDKCENVISNHKNEVIQFFSMRKADFDIGSRYDTGSKFMMAQCFYLPENYNNKMLDFYNNIMNGYIHNNCNKIDLELYNGIRNNTRKDCVDPFIALFLKNRKERYFISVPSLVQHRICRSIINPTRSMFRQSKTFIEGIYE